MNNIVSRKFNIRSDSAIFALAFAAALILQGAVPFFLTPTLGQAVWSMGFAKSFLNDSVFSIYAHNIGAPEPAAMAFGLAGAWLSAVFMRLGLVASDAYSAMIATCLSIAFCSAYGVARHFSVVPKLSILAAFCWLTMPVTWAHAGYSMLSTGIALLPFYLLSSIKIFSWNPGDAEHAGRKPIIWVLLYPVICVISIFTDGYSFMMFAVGSSILGVWMFVSGTGVVKKRLVLLSLPVHFAGFCIAYALYGLYIGKPEFAASHIDFFRGWGVDLTFLVLPTQGMHWLPDLIGWSVPRSEDRFFGDLSVWVTSFSVPVIIGAVWAVCNVHRRHGIVLALVLVTVFGFYMSLGPSFKFNSVKPEGQKIGQGMAKEYAVAPTGSAILSENLPGFKNMRASYRWGALGVFGAWGLLVFAMSARHKRKTIVVASILVGAVTLLNLPVLSNKLKNDAAHRAMFFALESDLIDDLRGFVNPEERVAFLPWRNDFLVNYVVSSLNVVSFNIGGDKNLEEARRHWPETMRQFPMGHVDRDFAGRVLLLFARHETDAVVLPYIDMLWAAHRWPYPVQYKEELAPVVAKLKQSGFVDVVERDLYAVVRLRPRFTSMESDELVPLIGRAVCIAPFCLERDEFDVSTPTIVGELQGSLLLSTGTEGFIHFGPYAAMNAGSYRLTVNGSAEKTATAWADVVSGRGNIRHAVFPLAATDKERDILAEGEVVLDEFVQDIEVRVYVGGEDSVVLKGYCLTPVHQ